MGFCVRRLGATRSRWLNCVDLRSGPNVRWPDCRPAICFVAFSFQLPPGTCVREYEWWDWWGGQI